MYVVSDTSAVLALRQELLRRRRTSWPGRATAALARVLAWLRATDDRAGGLIQPVAVGGIRAAQ